MRSRSLAELGFIAGQALMELLPIWMICSVVRASVATPLAWGFVHAFVLQLSAAMLAWYSRRWRLPSIVHVLVLLVTGVCLVASWLFIGLMPHPFRPDTAFSCLVAMYLCGRGLLIGLHVDRTGGVLRWFGIGIGLCVMLFAFLALARVPRAALPFEQLRALCLGYFALGATLAGLAQRRGRLARTKSSTALSPAALFAVAAPALALLVVAVLPAFGPEGTRSLVRSSLSELDSIARWILEALRMLGAGLAQFLRWVGSLWDETGNGAPPFGAGCGERESWTTPVRPQEMTKHMGGAETLTFLVQALALFCFAYFVIGLARKRMPAPAADAAQDEQEESGSTWSWQLLLQPLDRLRRMRSQDSAGAPIGEASADVRELYRALLIWAKAHGERRSVSTTAQEFAMQLSRTLSSRRLQISQLTEYYSRERYAERRCTPAETQEARRLLDDITTAATLHKRSSGQ